MLLYCPYLSSDVELSPEREKHIAESHPDLLPEYRQQLENTLFEPDQVRLSARFRKARLFTRWFDSVRGGKYNCGGGDIRRQAYEPPLGYYGLYGQEAGGRGQGMEEKLAFKYDREADILYINRRPPYPEQESEEMDDDIVVRLNPKSGEVENVEILFFSTRLLRDDAFEIPIVFESITERTCDTSNRP